MHRWFISSSGFALVILGIVLIPMPLPIGIFVVTFGLCLLIHSNDWIRQKVRTFREHHPDLNQKFRRASAVMPKPLRRIISRTKPASKQKRHN
ncbi:PGPGW domain-containing protein [Echinimonas agarilytica]|uniref:PGPGW domain-containing protein n=1 Tax=Echinimonas agarilytica TaxID=1215918 RepID=UPI003D80FB33